MEEGYKEGERTPMRAERGGLYEKSTGFVLTYKKAQRVAAALYLVTNLFPEGEPLRYKLREGSLELLSSLLSFHRKTVSFGIKEHIAPIISELVGLLEIGRVSGIVSDMNFEVLKREYMKVLEGVSDLKDIEVVSVDESIEEDEQKILSVLANGISKGHRIGHFDKGHNNRRKEYKRQKPSPSPAVRDTKEQASPGAKTAPVKRADEQRRRLRQESIIDLFRGGKALSVKDVSLAIGGYSEKTLQRDLVELVRQGVLRKEGERRWSRYMLAEGPRKSG